MISHPDIDVAGLRRAVSMQLALPDTSPHTLSHMDRVARNVAIYAEYMREADLAVGLAFAYTHDARRVSDAHDHRHPDLGVRLAADWNGRFYDFAPERLNLLTSAIREHAGGIVFEDATRDACVSSDRADLSREGVWLTPRAQFFTPRSWAIYRQHIAPLKAQEAA